MPAKPLLPVDLGDLIEACSEALYEYEGRQVNVSRRTIQMDIQMMRSDKLGYNAPIIVYDKKYYKYEDENYSITNIPLTEIDMQVLSESVEMLKQFKDFSLFAELKGIIQRLEDKVYTEKTHQSAVIHLDKNDKLKGLEHLDALYQAIVKKLVLTITYQSFKAKRASNLRIHPFILKEYNNRWFLIGKTEADKPILTLALDRILHIGYDFHTTYLEESFDGDAYYKDTIGVTVMNPKALQKVVLKINKLNAPYVLTKPFHHSQQIVENAEDGSMTFSIAVHLNFELERLILGFGDAIEVLEPQRLRKRIKNKLEFALEKYT
ncbi:WYL domain-containing protein [Catalinimonas sp. 4WD22]|uniref:helix-turn-helix transcriptional regulator n=1 Tax=Catalinimonas locisalis TaxID=3133978 RepID=UPI003101264A